MQFDVVLTREDQLGNALSVSVTEHRRADFSMLLAMLSQDALEFSQFHLPESELNEADLSELALKKELQIGPQQALAPETYDMSIGQNNASRLAQSSLTTLKLQQCLSPEPLAIRNDKTHIPLEVVDNCEIAVRKRLESIKSGASIEEKPAMNAAGFYDQLASGQMQSALQLTA
ncbi:MULTISPECIES: VC2046/SO_2500 family protein [Pseudoalteromonas]|uniref:QueD like 2 n=1 Tax=Pseudoalteromonas amylolytica TaxID=1859457 RepID=A0A1S1MS19_9GAMM|nr:MULTISPECIES: VC2046/SO_2500 family protein [Pseudoalteromonas]OHU86575.1 queD like 2 [Pseudoalteromonas sp. JW3]OHU88900.1 queD like 2 [Pseudoalteromonas amylolytica]